MLSVRFIAGGHACNPVILRIGPTPLRHLQRSPKLGFPPTRSGCRPLGRISIARTRAAVRAIDVEPRHGGDNCTADGRRHSASRPAASAAFHRSMTRTAFIMGSPLGRAGAYVGGEAMPINTALDGRSRTTFAGHTSPRYSRPWSTVQR